MGASLLSLPLFALLVAAALGSCPGGASPGEDGTCPSEAAEDTTALLQARGRRQLARHRPAFAARVVRNWAGPKRRAPVPPEKAVHETQAECGEILKIVKAHRGISYGSVFWKFVCEEEIRRHLMELKGGCLYLPASEHVKVFYENVDRINPWHLVDMLENSFFPFESGKCPTDDRDKVVRSTEGALYTTCADAPGFVGAKGECVQVKPVASTPAGTTDLKIYELDGMMGVDEIWGIMMSEAGDGAVARKALLADRSSRANNTAEARRAALTLIKVWAVVCDPGDGSVGGAVADWQIVKQVEQMNKHFSGGDRCNPPLTYAPQYEDTRFRFQLGKIERVTNPLCGGPNDCANYVTQLTSQVVPVEGGRIKILLCDTSLLGRASFPGYPDSQRILLVNPGTLPQGAITDYNEGDTGSHEMGHYLGLYHTFQGGCSNSGDLVGDTDPEQSPFYGCPSAPRLTCGGGIPDPVHNFMDYSNDRCLCSFTAGQTRRMYEQLQLHDPPLLR